ncbi:MAG: hypothetical protein NTY02_12620 [Acidobacteria bacterium]|nr:hypothetical protein [Acidobacteriota bacterium]
MDLPASGSRSFTLQTGIRPQAVAGITVANDANTLTVNTQAATFLFNKAEFLVRGQSFQVQSGGANYQAVPTNWTIEEQGPMKVVVRVEGV